MPGKSGRKAPLKFLAVVVFHAVAGRAASTVDAAQTDLDGEDRFFDLLAPRIGSVAARSTTARTNPLVARPRHAVGLPARPSRDHCRARRGEIRSGRRPRTFPRKLSQGFGIVGAVGQRHGFKIKATRGVWAPGLGLVRRKQMLPAAADRIDRSDFLRGELLLCILLLVQEGAERVGGRHER